MPISADIPDEGRMLRTAIRQRYAESDAEMYSIDSDRFESIVVAVIIRYCGDFSEPEKLEMIQSLRVNELVLARACSSGSDVAWDEFLARYRSEMYQIARQLTHDEVAGRELADGLYAELYGLPNREGRRISKLDYYMGRGSLQGWLRTVLAQRLADRFRSQEKNVSLDEQLEAGIPFAANPVNETPSQDSRTEVAVVSVLEELSREERFLLASYYLDQNTLASIGRQLGVHESTVSRKLEKLTGELRKRLRKRLQNTGISSRRCEEILSEIDVRDLNINIAEKIQQER